MGVLDSLQSLQRLGARMETAFTIEKLEDHKSVQRSLFIYYSVYASLIVSFRNFHSCKDRN